MEFNLTTFVFEIVNFLVLLWLLQRIVFKPLRAGIDRRRAATDQRWTEAEAAKREAEELKREYEQRSEELGSLRDRVIRDGTEQAAKERARMLEQAREDAAAERARAQHLLETEREAALGWARDMVIERGTELAGRLLMQLAPAAVDRALLDQLLQALEREAASLRADLLDSPGGSRPEIEITSARPLAEQDMELLRAGLKEALGVAPRLQLREDDSLVAGAVVSIGNRVLDVSIQGHLEALRARAREVLNAGGDALA